MLLVNHNLINYLMSKFFDKFFQSNWDKVALLGIAVWLCIVAFGMIVDYLIKTGL